MFDKSRGFTVQSEAKWQVAQERWNRFIEMFVASILICGKLLCLQKLLTVGGGERVDVVLASSEDPDKTAIRSQELTFSHYRSQPFVQCTYLTLKTSQRKQNLNFPSEEIENCSD